MQLLKTIPEAYNYTVRVNSADQILFWDHTEGCIGTNPVLSFRPADAPRILCIDRKRRLLSIPFVEYSQ